MRNLSLSMHFDRNEMRIKLGNIRVGGMPNERKVLIYRIEIEKLN